MTALARGLEVLACFRHGDRMLGNQELSRRCGPRQIHGIEAHAHADAARLSGLRRRQRQIQSRHRHAEPGQRHAVAARHPQARASLDAAAGRIRPVHGESRQPRSALDDLHRCGSRLGGGHAESGHRRTNSDRHLGDGPRLPDGDVRKTNATTSWRGCASWPTPAAGPICSAGVAKALRDIRELGVCCSFGDWQKDVNAIAVPVRPGGGLPPMAINCGAPAYMVSKEFLLERGAAAAHRARQRFGDLPGHRRLTIWAPAAEHVRSSSPRRSSRLRPRANRTATGRSSGGTRG